MQVADSNSRIRIISVHSVAAPEALHQQLMGRLAIGDMRRSYDVEWENHSYRFGGDWLTGQAFELIRLDGANANDLSNKLQQFETSLDAKDKEPFMGLDLYFGFYHRNKPKYDPGIPVRLHKCGLVHSGSSIVLCWVDVSIESDDPDCWADFISVIGKRQGADYLKNFHDREGIRKTHAELMQKIENWFFRDLAPAEILYTARNMYRFARFKLLTESTRDALRFLHLTSGDSENYESLASMAEEDMKKTTDIRWSWSMDAVSSVLLSSGDIEKKGAVRFQNSFRFADCWLTYAICLSQYHLMIDMERDIVRTMMTMHQIRRKNNPFSVLAGVVRMKKSYEEIMDRFMDSYWKLGLIQIHSHAERHTLFLGIQTTLGCQDLVVRFHGKLTTLGAFLMEKQKGVVGWFLIYVPFVSLILGLLGINVKGITSGEGLSLSSLISMLIAITATYLLVIVVSINWLTSSECSRRKR